MLGVEYAEPLAMVEVSDAEGRKLIAKGTAEQVHPVKEAKDQKTEAQKAEADTDSKPVQDEAAEKKSTEGQKPKGTKDSKKK